MKKVNISNEPCGFLIDYVRVYFGYRGEQPKILVGKLPGLGVSYFQTQPNRFVRTQGATASAWFTMVYYTIMFTIEIAF